ncbi:MAG: hypothetical protein M9936_23510 [Caldilinea sp.]|nr:hypothetical protein [Caldilineaceae bacterium]MCB9120184.1 hypothetical protein [Caldilineaceae bacterium]MCB9123844.1 hypothetical protein [Caldilineaceae bacterium]MCO5212676.1 hypothetical protein [Caldilinea sp.]MCW5841733.1 hypothetical protein [Caldilinea sp.]
METSTAQRKRFLSGPFGAGKTTAAIDHLRHLLRQERVRGDDILVLVPQRTLATPYHEALRSGDMPGGASVRVTTFASLAQQAVELYWPLVAGQAGFSTAAQEPTFLTLETSQYHMAPLVDDAIGQGAFDGVRVERSRIISQVLDNLNKAALQGLTIDAAYARLELAVPLGEQRAARLNALRAARAISIAFRRHCLERAILDFSLQVTLFNEQVLTNEWSRTHLLRTHRHLVYDNAEEDTLSAHRLVEQWLPVLESALIIADDDGGYRTFLGADPQGVDTLANACPVQQRLDNSFVMSPAIEHLDHRIDWLLEVNRTAPASASVAETGRALVAPDELFRFYPQMVEWAGRQINHLVREEGVAPGEIAILAPFVSDALRFSLQTTLERYGIALATHRPSRPLEAEPAARTLLTLARLAHPLWGMAPAPADVTLALTVAVERLDPVRASLLSAIVYPPRRRTNELGTFAAVNEEMRERISYAAGEAYDRLREWLYTYRAEALPLPLDQFFARLFGEVLSQPGFGFHEDYDAARVASQLVESARKFRWALEDEPAGSPDSGRVGRTYVHMAESGAIGALYLPGWQAPADAVFLAPAYTFLLRNRAVDVQFWLDIGSTGWWERLYQPLTHPYVLSARWPLDTAWTDRDEYNTRQETMRRLLLGLVRRTRQRIYLGASDYSESGFEQRGPLLTIVNRLLSQ